eukprot:TRINITY_DN4801_c0_g1_i2.p1 TRINITY_DN4801_c0_g1~~TRINITY_DN4801_c0_g1_i2.p1  ORF type:complete len:218 (-),score=35.53 TRINITY_DN4801_c0_g1_i2:16-669(-)
MKVELICDNTIRKYSTDFVTRSIVECGVKYKFDMCDCKILNVSCKNCSVVVGYHVIEPCSECSISNNGHYFMFNEDEIVPTERIDDNGDNVVWGGLKDDTSEPLIPFDEDCEHICSICYEIYNNPVKLKCGHNFCKKCVYRTVDLQKKCPLDRIKASIDDIENDEILSSIVGDIYIYCKYACEKNSFGIWEKSDNGCDQVIKIKDREEHERCCKYSN